MKNVIIVKRILPAIETDRTLFGHRGIKRHAADTSGEVLDLHLHRRIRADLIITDIRAQNRDYY
jgi:hypothetical protein